MVKENSAGLGVFNNYGPRTVDEGRFSEKRRQDSSLEVEVAFHGNDFLTVVGEIPAGALLRAATVDIVEAFDVGGTTPNIAIGTDGSAATNGVLISEAILEAVGKADIFGAAAGTWAALLASATTVAVELEGDTTVVTTQGHAVVKLYFDLA